MKKLNPIFLLIIICIQLGCNQEHKKADMDTDIAEIMALYDTYFEGVNTGDLDLFMTVWADNGIRSEPGMPEIIGKENVRARFRELMTPYDHTITIIGDIKVETCENLAFGYCTVQVRSIPKEGGSEVVQEIKATTIFKKQSDGSWKIRFDCVNYQPAWGGDSIPDALKEVNPYY